MPRTLKLAFIRAHKGEGLLVWVVTLPSAPMASDHAGDIEALGIEIWGEKWADGEPHLMALHVNICTQTLFFDHAFKRYLQSMQLTDLLLDQMAQMSRWVGLVHGQGIAAYTDQSVAHSAAVGLLPIFRPWAEPLRE